MNRIEEIKRFNKYFVENKEYKKFETTKYPNQKMVILTCMDTRLVELLPQALNIKNGDAKIIKNAGAIITSKYGSVMRSILIAIYMFEVEDILVIGHRGCGVCNLESEEVLLKMKQRGITDKVIKGIEEEGIEISRWFNGFDSIESSIIDTVKEIKKHPLVPENSRVHGFVIDSSTGELQEV